MIEIQDKPKFDELINRLKSAEVKIQKKGMRSALVGYAKPIKAKLKFSMPSKSGALRKSIGHRSMLNKEKPYAGFSRNDVVLAVGSTRKVAFKVNKKSHHDRLGFKLHWLNEGTDRHRIPSLKHRLKKISFAGKVFSKIIHPGTRATHILSRAHTSTQSQSRAQFDIAMKKFLKKQGL